MSTSRLITPSSLNSLQIKFYCQSRAQIFKPSSCLAFSKPQNGLLHICNGRRAQTRGLVVHGGLQSGGPLPSEPPPSLWPNTATWILAAMMTLGLPFLRHKWGPLFKFSKEAEAVVETADHVAEVIEDVAEGVEKVMEEVAGELPEGGRLGHAVEFIENVAQETAKDAHLAGDIIDKVEKMEEEVESFMERADGGEVSGTPKQGTDQTQR
ncbi:uncharacterized protein LOC127800062 [Diospyros lotus]|uniref:uncharacterized protein LOC127800062 n=1 Tax=Diospyros lotus TaxID=55363 RepID=UPI00224FCD90|nr:uncharacterized protein LOC127800062 [Diospyros lotus]